MHWRELSHYLKKLFHQKKGVSLGLFKRKEACMENKQNYTTIKREERWGLGEKTSYKAVLIEEKQPLEQKRRVTEKNKISSKILVK